MVRRPARRPSLALWATLCVQAAMGVAGQGMHALLHAHPAHPVVDAAPTEGQACAACCCGSHGFTAAVRPRHATERGAAVAWSIASGRLEHDPHHCVVCRVLATLKTVAAPTTAIAPPADAIVAAPAGPCPVASAGAFSELGPRGPPARG